MVLAEARAGVLKFTLDRPEKRNALSSAVIDALEEVLEEYRDDCSLVLAVITGAGDKAFASGGDLVELAAIRSAAAAVQMAERYRTVFDAIRGFPVPVVAALNGDALGGGAELAMACDMRIAAAHARIGFLQGKLAITSGWGGGADLIAAVGTSRALRMMGTAELLSAETAREWGLIEVVAPQAQDFGAFVEGFVGRFSERTPAVMRAYKAMIRASRFGSTRDELVRIETDNFAQVWAHDDHWNAVEASSGRAGRQ